MKTITVTMCEHNAQYLKTLLELCEEVPFGILEILESVPSIDDVVAFVQDGKIVLMKTSTITPYFTQEPS